MNDYADGIKQNGEMASIGGSAAPLVRQSITFANSTGTVNIFTVTGDVILRIIAVTKTGLASAGTCNAELGLTGKVSAMIAATDVTLMAAGEIWHDNSPDSKVEAWSVSKDYIATTGVDVIMTLSAQIDSGVLAFYCHWIGLSADANVVAS